MRSSYQESTPQKNLALSTAVIRSVGNHATPGGLSPEDFRVHLLGRGVIARSLAEFRGVPPEAR